MFPCSNIYLFTKVKYWLVMLRMFAAILIWCLSYQISFLSFSLFLFHRWLLPLLFCVYFSVSFKTFVSHFVCFSRWRFCLNKIESCCFCWIECANAVAQKSKQLQTYHLIADYCFAKRNLADIFNMFLQHVFFNVFFNVLIEFNTDFNEIECLCDGRSMVQLQKGVCVMHSAHIVYTYVL